MSDLAGIQGIDTIKIGEWYSQPGCNPSRVLLLKLDANHAGMPGKEYLTIIQCVEHQPDYSHQRRYTINGNYDLTQAAGESDFNLRVLQLAATGKRDDSHTVGALANMLKFGGS